MKKVALFLALSAVSVFADGIGIYAEGPAPQTNFGIIYSSGFFGIKNGYSYSHTYSESKNDTMKTSESDVRTNSVEISPMLIVNANIVNIEIAPAYQFSFGGTKSTTYSTITAGSSSTTESTQTSHAFKLNFLLTKVFAEKYKLGVGTNSFRYNFGDTESDFKSSTTTTTTKSKTHPNGYTDASVFYIHFSVYFI